VEAGGQALVPDFSYRTDSTSIKTDTRKPACNGTGQTKSVKGPSALGILTEAADTRSSLDPVGVSDQFSFGLLVCGVGKFTSSDSAFWLYKVNRVSPEVGADQRALRSADQVLWYFQDLSKSSNTGDELVIDAPARAQAGSTVTATVSAYAANGAKRPAAGAKVLGPNGTVAVADDAGRAQIRLDRPGYAPLRAGRGPDIPSRVIKVCVGADIEDCSPVRGRRIFGTDAADTLGGTRGRDVITAGGSDDVIDVRGGGLDKVRCGDGIDSVRLRKGDRAARDCEFVNGRRRR
jgi:Ca2+-binding RTX toxin-like protein